MGTEKINRIVNKVRQDAKLSVGEKLLVCMNRSCDSMLEDAYLLTAEGAVRDVFWTTSMSGDQADEASIQLVEDGPDVVVFHESRPSSRDGHPNGIRIHHEELDFPCVVFFNSGKECLTVDGEWVEPGEYTTVQEVDINSPEAQKVLREWLRSPEVQKSVEKVRREYEEKKKREEDV